MEIVVGGLAGVIAVVAMNPLDLVKIRMQLQGEGATRGSHQRPYRNTFHALYTIAKTEGILALERGLVAAGLLGFFNNGTRLGLYKIADNKGWNRKEGGEVCFWKAVMWSSFSGGASGILTNPMIIVKTRLQSMSKANRLRVGKAKYNYKGMIDAYRQIYKKEGIWNGFYCGAKATGIRLAVGSAAQLTTFSTAKEFLYYRGICQENKFGLAFLASLLCSIVNSLAVCPLDVCTIRLYNQGQKKIYNGIIDCLYKIVTKEGFHGLYKGLGPLYLRLAPVTTISLVAWDLLNHLLLPFSRKVYYVTHNVNNGSRVSNRRTEVLIGGLLVGLIDLGWVRLAAGLSGYVTAQTFTRLDLTSSLTKRACSLMEILIGGLSGVIAMAATNPLEVVKVRMQLQGEGEKHGSHQRPYKNVVHGLYTIAKTEGILALQRGLLAATVFGFCINGLRLGLYKLADNRGLNRKENGELAFHKTVICSTVSGGIAGAATTPMTIVKTRLQAMTQAKNISVGKAKYNYTGMLDAYRQIYKNEGGIKGLFAGAKASGIRIALGSCSQLTSFSTAKEFLYYHGICQDSKFGLAFLASVLSAIINALVVCPLDVATIRLYSQGDKKLYNGLVDCLTKIFKVEGIYGLYKGFGPLYFRLAPLTTFTLVVWDLLNHLLVPNNKSV